MTYAPGPPSGPPYGGPPAGGAPYGGPAYGAVPYGPPYRRPPRSAASTTLLTALVAALFVVATAAAAVGVHHKGIRKVAVPTANGSYAGLTPGAGIPAAAGSSSYPTGALSVPPAPTYTPPAPTPTHQPLDPAAINRTFEVYMNALLYRSLQQVKGATCPRLRHTETGTALDHKYINRWRGHEYTIDPDSDYVIISATVRYVNPRTGGNGASHVYSWYVDRYPDGQYWVCGIL